LISIIVGYRNRELERVKRSMDSIAAQTCTNFELIFVDYGSDIEISKSVKVLIESYQFAKYIYIDTRGMFWNRAHALNIGAKNVKGDILLFYDIDLIISSSFLEDLASIKFEDTFYTFSCFYLPQDFNYKLNLFSAGIHCEQNYVGLHAIKKDLFVSINGFDEYFMVWGGEDDDLYMRLSKKGLKRQHMNTSKYKIFHQWHSIESPNSPSFWYLEMVQYLSNKKFNSEPYATELLKIVSLSDRLLLKDRHSLKYDLIIEVNSYSGFLVYNGLIDGMQDPNIHSIFFCYKDEVNSNAKKNKLTNIFIWKKKSKTRSRLITKKDVELFIQYIIGKNRTIIFDYFIEYEENDLRLFVVKK